MDDLPTPMNEQDDPSLFNSDTFLNDIYPHQQPQIHWDDEYFSKCLTFNGGNHADVLGDLDIIMDEHRNDHRPKKALTGFLPDYSSESDDAESISATVKPVGTNYYKLNGLNKIFSQDFRGRTKPTLHHLFFFIITFMELICILTQLFTNVTELPRSIKSR